MTFKEIWVDSAGQKFQIQKLQKRDQDNWVVYCKLSNGQTYSCRLESFQKKFTRQTNER